jgi:hypothetical protein
MYSLLKKYTIPFKNNRTNRRGFPKHRSMTLGITKGRFNGITGLSYYSKKYPELYQSLKDYGIQICNFPFTSIHINHNVVCPPHRDTKNQTKSCIVSFGEYTGGELVIEGEIFNTFENPVTFNGAEKEHWNLPFKGNKYSIVFF